MPAARSSAKTPAIKTFSAALERMEGNLGWVIIRIPFDVVKLWSKRGQLRVKGDINGFEFSSALFPTGKGEHFLLVNKKMQKGGKTAPGLSAKFLLQPDTAPRDFTPPKELLRELSQSKRLLKFYESLTQSAKHWIAKWTADPKSADARTRRAQQIAERLMETLEAEKDLPPMIDLALRQNPRAREKWDKTSPSHRRAHLMAIFYYRTPASRARCLNKCVEELLGKKSSQELDREDLD
jgi:uncharacterized protein YdeI (YjbR/CyaY-like superfamily)